jgi:hypothetical protein
MPFIKSRSYDEANRVVQTRSYMSIFCVCCGFSLYLLFLNLLPLVLSQLEASP